MKWKTVLLTLALTLLLRTTSIIALTLEDVTFPAPMHCVDLSASYMQDHQCRFWGMIGNPPSGMIENHVIGGPPDWPNSLQQLSLAGWDGDGWGIGFYCCNCTIPFVRNSSTPAHENQPCGAPCFEANVTEMAGFDPWVAVAHVRKGTSGPPGIPNPHPFRRRTRDGKWWLFGHNGHVDIDVLLSLIDPDYLLEQPPSVGPPYVDSDLYFIYLLQCMEEPPPTRFGGVWCGVQWAVWKLDEYSVTGALNFFLTNGESLWAFRRGNTLYYYRSSRQYSAIASQYPTQAQDDWIEMNDYEMVELREDGIIVGPCHIDEWIGCVKPVGGVLVPVDKFGLLAPYLGVVSTILVATVATIIYVKRVERREKKNTQQSNSLA